MRVLHVIPSVSPRRGGPSEVVLRMVEAQRALGLDATIVTSDEDAPPDLAGIPVRTFPRGLTQVGAMREYAWCPSFGPWLRTNLTRFDLLHVHAIFSYLPTTAMRIAREARIPYVSRPLGQLGRWPLRQSAWKKAVYLKLVERRNLEGAAALHFTSAAEQEQAGDLGLTPRALIIPHGVTLPPRSASAAEILRQKLGLAEARHLVLFLGRLHPKKGLDLLLRALSRLPSPRPLLLVAGEGPERATLQQLSRTLRIESDVRWLGHVEGEWKQLCLQGADLFALTSHHENFGVAVLEALAAGTPVLVSPQVALASLVTAHGWGAVAPLDPEAIARALSRLLARPVRSQSSRAFVEKNYSWTANAEHLHRVYGQLTEKSR